jgi:hypothetical protein
MTAVYIARSNMNINQIGKRTDSHQNCWQGQSGWVGRETGVSFNNAVNCSNANTGVNLANKTGGWRVGAKFGRGY